MEQAPGHRAFRLQSPGPDQRTAGAELRTAIRDCLGRLVRPRRLAATLYLHGHTVPEIGTLLRWSGAKANNLVYRGIADLRRCLADKGLAP